MTATKKLTKTVVDALQPAAKPFRIFDSEVKGFCVRVSTSGDKLWQLEYRPAPGGRGVPIKRLTLAAVGTLTPDEARAAAKATLAEVAKGVDPVADRIGKRKELTIGGLIDIYEKEGCFVQSGIRIGQPMKPLTKAYTLARLRHHVVPLLGNKRVSEVGANDIERMVRDIGAGKTARDEKVGPRRRVIVRGGEGAARKVVRDLSAVFTFAVLHKPPLASENPCKKARVNKVDGKRTRFLDLGEVQRLGKALEELEAEGVNPKALDITRLWALTGARRNEIVGLRWSEVDLKDGCLRLDDSKTGKSTRPLAASALMLLSALPRYGDSNSPDACPRGSFRPRPEPGIFRGQSASGRRSSRRPACRASRRMCCAIRLARRRYRQGRRCRWSGLCSVTPTRAVQRSTRMSTSRQQPRPRIAPSPRSPLRWPAGSPARFCR